LGADFSQIAARYDLLNRVLSLGQEQNWRRRGAAYLPTGRILDLGSGTGAAASIFGESDVVALDPEPRMLDLSPIELRVVGFGEQLPFRDGSFDGVFSAYVLRNVDSVASTLGEIRRVLRPGGRAAVIDLTRPKSARWAKLHRVGTSMVLPAAGTAVGGRTEYQFLHESLDKLPPPEMLYADAPMTVVEMWRMGPLGFVYCAVLERTPG